MTSLYVPPPMYRRRGAVAGLEFTLNSSPIVALDENKDATANNDHDSGSLSAEEDNNSSCASLSSEDDHDSERRIDSLQRVFRFNSEEDDHLRRNDGHTATSSDEEESPEQGLIAAIRQMYYNLSSEEMDGEMDSKDEGNEIASTAHATNEERERLLPRSPSVSSIEGNSSSSSPEFMDREETFSPPPPFTSRPGVPIYNVSIESHQPSFSVQPCVSINIRDMSTGTGARVVVCGARVMSVSGLGAGVRVGSVQEQGVFASGARTSRSRKRSGGRRGTGSNTHRFSAPIR